MRCFAPLLRPMSLRKRFQDLSQPLIDWPTAVSLARVVKIAFVLSSGSALGDNSPAPPVPTITISENHRAVNEFAPRCLEGLDLERRGARGLGAIPTFRIRSCSLWKEKVESLQYAHGWYNHRIFLARIRPIHANAFAQA